MERAPGEARMIHSSEEKAKATICKLASQHAFEDMWDGKNLSDKQISSQSAIYAKAYQKARETLLNNGHMLMSMKFDYNFGVFDTAYSYIRGDVVEAVLQQGEGETP